MIRFINTILVLMVWHGGNGRSGWQKENISNANILRKAVYVSILFHPKLNFSRSHTVETTCNELVTVC